MTVTPTILEAFAMSARHQRAGGIQLASMDEDENDRGSGRSPTPTDCTSHQLQLPTDGPKSVKHLGDLHEK